MRSRLSRRIEQQNKKAFIGSLLGIIFVAFVLIKYGLPFLATASFFLTGYQGDERQEKKERQGFIAPPLFDAFPTATNSAVFAISGSASSKKSVILYINDDLIDTVTTDDKGKFSFSELQLSKGANEIKAKVKDENKESKYSETVTVLYTDTAPTLTLDSPQGGKSFSKDDKNALISGKTDLGVKVTVNELWAIVDASGAFSYTLPLQSGENKITVIATDQAGNETKIERIITYSP